MRPGQRKKRARVHKPPACGTTAGYEGHLRRREWPCASCLFGSRTFTNEEIGALINDQDDKDRDQQLWNTYRLSLERFNEIFHAQGACCACCGATNSGDAPWHIDHDHETHLIRGVLCLRCNTGIGQLGDQLPGLLRAVAYLQAHHVRGGHALASSPPAKQEDKPVSALMRRCFELFQQGVAKKNIVIILRLEPSLVGHLYDVWCNDYRETMPPLREQHLFQIARDPFRCLCACGFERVCDEKNFDSVLAATNAVNDHIKQGNAQKGAWESLKAEEDDRRAKEEQKQKEALRQQALEDIRQREAQRTQKQALQERETVREERKHQRETKKRWKDYSP